MQQKLETWNLELHRYTRELTVLHVLWKRNVHPVSYVTLIRITVLPANALSHQWGSNSIFPRWKIPDLNRINIFSTNAVKCQGPWEQWIMVNILHSRSTMWMCGSSLENIIHFHSLSKKSSHVIQYNGVHKIYHHCHLLEPSGIYLWFVLVFISGCDTLPCRIIT